MRLITIGSAKIDPHVGDWGLFTVGKSPVSVAPAVGALRTGLVQGDQTPVIDAAQNEFLCQKNRTLPPGQSALQQAIFAQGNPSWHRLDPLTVTIKTEAGSYYVLKRTIDGPPSDSGAFPTLKLFSRGAKPVSLTGLGNATVRAYEAPRQTIETFLSDMTKEGLTVSELGSESTPSEREAALGEVVLQIFNLLDVPSDLPGRAYGNRLEKAAFLRIIGAFDKELSYLPEQMSAWRLAARNGASDEMENPISAGVTEWQRRIDEILRSHLTPDSVANIVGVMFSWSLSAAPLLERFFAHDDVQSAVREWNLDPRARRILIGEFLHLVHNTVYNGGPRDMLWAFYGLKLLGLNVRNVQEFIKLQKILLERELGADWMREYADVRGWDNESAKAQKLNAAIAQFWDEQFARVMDPSITRAVRDDRHNIEQILASLDDAVIISSQRIPSLKPAFGWSGGSGEA